MPNWIEGTLKLRGKRENIRKFFNEGLQPSTYFGEERPLSEFVTDESGDDELFFSFNDEPHIKGTRRAFITGDCAELYEEYGIVCVDIKQAWSFNSNQQDLETWKEIAKIQHRLKTVWNRMRNAILPRTYNFARRRQVN